MLKSYSLFTMSFIQLTNPKIIGNFRLRRNFNQELKCLLIKLRVSKTDFHQERDLSVKLVTPNDFFSPSQLFDIRLPMIDGKLTITMFLFLLLIYFFKYSTVSFLNLYSYLFYHTCFYYA